MKIIGLASTSGRRHEALRAIPGIEVIAVGGGPEDNTQDLLTIALDKIAFAYPLILEILSNKSNHLEGVVGADTGTSPHMIVNDAYIKTSQGKPGSIEVLRANFQGMKQFSDIKGAGYYEVVSSSAFQDTDGSIAGTQVTKVALNKDKLAALSTEDGLNLYLDYFAKFYASEAYVSKKLNKVTPFDLSGGLSLPVFLKMGMVEELDGHKLADLPIDQRQLVVSLAILNVAVGFSPQVLHRISPDSIAILLKWDWLNQVVEESLSSAQV